VLEPAPESLPPLPDEEPESLPDELFAVSDELLELEPVDEYKSLYQPPPFRAKDDREISRSSAALQTSQVRSLLSFMLCMISKTSPHCEQRYS